MKTKVNLSEKIREHLSSLKPADRSPKAVAEALKTKGFNVSPTLVAVTKARMEGGKKKKKAIKPKIKSALTNPSSLNTLIHAKNFLNAAGSVKEAKNLLDIVSSLIS